MRDGLIHRWVVSPTPEAAAKLPAALLLQQRPGLTPDQVKALLLNTAAAIPGVPTGSQGRGELNLAAAAAAAVPGTVQSVAAGSGTGSLESARGGMHVSLDGSQLQGELHLFGQWQGATTATKIGSATMWSSDGSAWNGVAITGAGFTTDTTTAAGKAWGGRSWAGRSWAGNAWTGRSWASCSFVGRSWAGSGWSTGSWSAPITTNSWTGALWSTGDWK